MPSYHWVGNVLFYRAISLCPFGELIVIKLTDLIAVLQDSASANRQSVQFLAAQLVLGRSGDGAFNGYPKGPL
jgi:hypothetical protein